MDVDEEIKKIAIKKQQYEDFVKASIFYNVALRHLTVKYTPYPALNMIGYLRKEFKAYETIHNKL